MITYKDEEGEMYYGDIYTDIDQVNQDFGTSGACWLLGELVYAVLGEMPIVDVLRRTCSKIRLFECSIDTQKLIELSKQFDMIRVIRNNNGTPIDVIELQTNTTECEIILHEGVSVLQDLEYLVHHELVQVRHGNICVNNF